MHNERVEAAKIGGMVVREDILAARELRNVRRGSTDQDDVERKLVPATEYLTQLPESLEGLDGERIQSRHGFPQRHDRRGGGAP